MKKLVDYRYGHSVGSPKPINWAVIHGALGLPADREFNTLGKANVAQVIFDHLVLEHAVLYIVGNVPREDTTKLSLLGHWLRFRRRSPCSVHYLLWAMENSPATWLELATVAGKIRYEDLMVGLWIDVNAHPGRDWRHGTRVVHEILYCVHQLYPRGVFRIAPYQWDVERATRAPLTKEMRFLAWKYYSKPQQEGPWDWHPAPPVVCTGIDHALFDQEEEDKPAEAKEPQWGVFTGSGAEEKGKAIEGGDGSPPLGSPPLGSSPLDPISREFTNPYRFMFPEEDDAQQRRQLRCWATGAPVDSPISSWKNGVNAQHTLLLPTQPMDIPGHAAASRQRELDLELAREERLDEYLRNNPESLRQARRLQWPESGDQVAESLQGMSLVDERSDNWDDEHNVRDYDNPVMPDFVVGRPPETTGFSRHFARIRDISNMIGLMEDIDDLPPLATYRPGGHPLAQRHGTDPGVQLDAP